MSDCAARHATLPVAAPMGCGNFGHRVVGHVEMTTVLMLLVANMSRRRDEIVVPVWATYRVLLNLLVDPLQTSRSCQAKNDVGCWLYSRVSLAGIISGGFFCSDDGIFHI